MLKNIQDRLLKFKEVNNLTYEELGKQIGTSKSVAYDICMKRRRFIDLHIVERILKLIGE